MHNKPLTFADFYTIVWSMVPQVWKEADDEYGKSLQILLYTMSQHMYYYFYNKIVYMDELFDPDLCPEKYLKFLAGMIGWKLIGADVDSWREQIKAAPLLYKVRGTKRGLLLAEKLVGYSIFMSELYRDHVGDAVPKERIFNNTPEEIKQKPWFRKVLTSVEGELLGGYAESDQFDSFNLTDIVKLDAFGQVVRPRVLSSTRKLVFKNLSTTEFYNNITGKNSIARYAKLPRINVVLQYEHDLDEELADGSIKQNNFKGALDLLLQFKPFHVYIENLEVRYSLAEYVFEQSNMSSETLNIHESVISAGHIDMTRAENTITFSGNPAVEFSTASAEVPLSPIYNRGVISSIYKVVDLSLAQPITENSLYTVAKQSFPIKSFLSGNTTDTVTLPTYNDTLLTPAEYVAMLPEPDLRAISGSAPTPLPQIYQTSDDTNYYFGLEYLGVTLKAYANSSDETQPVVMTWYKDSILYWTDPNIVANNNTPTRTVSILTIPEADLVGSHTYTCKATNSHGVVTSSNMTVSGINVPIHAIAGYNLKPYISSPILDFKAMFSTQRESLPTISIENNPIYSYKNTYTIGSTIHNDLILTTTVVHNMHQYDNVYITGITPLEYNGAYSVKDVITPTKLVVALPDGNIEAISVSQIATLKEYAINIVPQVTEDSDSELNKIAITTYTPAELAIIQDLGDLTDGPYKRTYTLGLPSSNIQSLGISAIPYRSAVTTDRDTQSIYSSPSRSWDLNDLESFSNFVGEASDLIFKNYVYRNSMVVALEIYLGEAGTWKPLLEPGIDYYFDNNNNIFLNSASISVKLYQQTDFSFLQQSKLHILYLTRTTYEDETSEGFQKRGFRYKSRENTKFSRQYAINTLPQDSLARLMPTEIVSVDSKTKQKTVLGTKQFKVHTDIPNRSTLKDEVIGGYTVVNKDPLNRIDQSKWTVYSPEFTAYYLGDQKITNNWWGNYYQAKFPDIAAGQPAFIPYDEVDRSEPAQKKNVYSNQWLSALRLLNLSDPKHFLVTRKTDSARTGFWKRNSCRFVSIPFIRSRRDALQVFRRDNPTFTRSEESTDYPVDSNVPYRLDNYKYILPDGTDVSYSYFTPGFSEPEKVMVTMDRGIGEKATLSSTGYGLNFPGSDTYYNNYSSDVTAETYFSKNVANEYVAKSSLYAGNIPVSRDPSLFTGITEGLDRFGLLVTGLEVVIDTFVAVANKSSFILSKHNLFVSWTEANTGADLAFGYYPPYNVICAPNIIVTLNGSIIPYGTGWTITFDRLKTLNILSYLEATDIITIEYQVFPGETSLATIPSQQVPHFIEVTLVAGDITQIQLGNRYFIDLPLGTGTPCVSWYSSVTAEFINYGVTPMEYQPFSLYEEAEPNIVVTVNGFPVPYKKGWSFFLRNTAGVISAAIALSPVISLSLTATDTIKVEYFSTT